MGNRNNIVIMIMVAIGWWGLMFPQYGLGGSVKVIGYENTGTETELTEPPEGDELFYHLLEAGPEHIVIKSKLYESVKAVLGAS